MRQTFASNAKAFMIWKRVISSEETQRLHGRIKDEKWEYNEAT